MPSKDSEKTRESETKAPSKVVVKTQTTQPSRVNDGTARPYICGCKLWYVC